MNLNTTPVKGKKRSLGLDYGSKKKKKILFGSKKKDPEIDSRAGKILLI